MVNEELRAKIIAHAKLKISRSQPLAILESVTLLEYIEELEAAQPTLAPDKAKVASNSVAVYCVSKKKSLANPPCG